MKVIRITAAAAAVLAAFAIAGCTAQPASTPDTGTSTWVTDTSTPAPTGSEVMTLTSSALPPPPPAPEPTPASEPAPAPEPEPVPAPAPEPAPVQEEPEPTTEARGEWIDPNWGWVSPETAQRALDHGIPWGGDVPGYLRCGTICGEEPTSGEVQSAFACLEGTGTCDSEPEAILRAADVPEEAISAARQNGHRAPDPSELPTPDPDPSGICSPPLLLYDGKYLGD
jgi:hypothetical protein